MKTRLQFVENNLGELHLAHVIVCAYCGAEDFNIFVLSPGNHQHLQCCRCKMSFCDGSCEAFKPQPA